jgi:hypothetical protein
MTPRIQIPGFAVVGQALGGNLAANRLVTGTNVVVDEQPLALQDGGRNGREVLAEFCLPTETGKRTYD